MSCGDGDGRSRTWEKSDLQFQPVIGRFDTFWKAALPLGVTDVVAYVGDEGAGRRNTRYVGEHSFGIEMRRVRALAQAVDDESPHTFQPLDGYIGKIVAVGDVSKAFPSSKQIAAAGKSVPDRQPLDGDIA